MSEARTSIRIGASGDVLAHSNLLRAAKTGAAESEGYSFEGFFRTLDEVVGASDLALFQQESPLTEQVRSVRGGAGVPPVFTAPSELAQALRAVGFHGCSIANNHAWDNGLAGVKETRAILDAAGLGVAGPNPHEPDGHGACYDVGGFVVAHFSYTYTLHNALLLNAGPPPHAPWAAVNLWPERGSEGIVSDARAAREAGADIVLVSMHWGDEYTREVNQDVQDLARSILMSGEVDWIIGNHPHVIQPCEQINGRWVSYSLGNLWGGRRASEMPENPQDTAYASVRFTRGDDGSFVRTLTFTPLVIHQESFAVERATPIDHADTYVRVLRTLRSRCRSVFPVRA